jgi:uncharacterized integral membrane protein
VTAYTYEPRPDEETAKMGNLFIVIEVISSGRMAEEVANLVIDTISGHYYESASGTDATHLDRFEAAIKATNAELNHYIDQGNAAWVGKLSAIVAVQADKEIHLTQTGSAEAFLSRGKASTRITAGDGPRVPQPNKTFGAITSGDLEAGDRLLLATPALIHQLPLEKLRTIVANTTPTGAVAEITGLLEGTPSLRVAALVVEMTTPEQAALQMRSDEPNDVVLNPNESPLEVARQAATPLAATALASSKKLSGHASRSIEAAKPHAKKAALGVTKLIRNFLTSKNAKRNLSILAGAIVLIVLVLIYSNHKDTTLTNLETRFHADAAVAQAGSSEAKLTTAQTDLASLAKSPHLAALNSAVAPQSVANLQQKINGLLDQAENLHRVNATTVATFSSKFPSPTHFELIGSSQAVAVDSAGKAIQVVNLANGSIKTSTASTSQLGSVVATTVNGTGDGVYILTKSPALWLYKPTGDSLVKQTIAQGGAPSSLAVASYNGNLYFLGTDSSVQKSLRTLAGFGPTATSLTTASNPELSGATTMAVDGSIYIISSKGLLQYVSGKLIQTVTVPASLTGAPILRSIGSGNTLDAISPTTSRIGLFSYTGSTLAFSEQFAINGANHVYDATTNPTTSVVYALADGKLVKFSLE